MLKASFFYPSCVTVNSKLGLKEQFVTHNNVCKTYIDVTEYHSLVVL